MKHLLLLFLLLAASPLPAQENGIEQPVDLTTLSTGEHVLYRQGKTGRSYFVQVSDPNDHLAK